MGGDPADAFDVVAPPCRGTALGPYDQAGINIARIADLWAQLMTDGLGYRRYGAQGGDWGAGVTARLGFAYPGQVIGMHTTSVSGAHERAGGHARTVRRRAHAPGSTGALATGRGWICPYPGHQTPDPGLRVE